MWRKAVFEQLEELYRHFPGESWVHQPKIQSIYKAVSLLKFQIFTSQTQALLLPASSIVVMIFVDALIESE
jgi:hypothetical protein